MTKQEKKVKKIMTFMSFDSKVDSCISPSNNYSKNNSRFQQNSLMDGLTDAKKYIKNIAESTLNDIAITNRVDVPVMRQLKIN